MFRASLCPSSGEKDRVLPHMVFCTGCAGCGWLWLCGAGWQAVCTQLVTARSCSPDDGHNYARNMLRLKFDNKHRISCILLVSLSSNYDILYLRFFRKSVEKIQLCLKSDIHNGYFTWTPVYNHDNIWRIVVTIRNVSNKLVTLF